MSCTPSEKEIGIIRQRIRPFVAKIRLELMKEEIESINASIRRTYKFKQAVRIVKKANAFFSENLAIAMSGGKDSLVALHLALKINPEIPVVFNNTTVEFPETIDFVYKLAKEWNFDLYVTKPEINFFKAVKARGWATHDNRWCCAPYKDEPALKFLSEKGIMAEITGTTRTESIYRRSLTPFRISTKNPGFMRVNPIYDWNQWEVWAYIRENELPYNPLYDMGYRRIGCWCCPLNGPTHYRRLRKTHPKLYDYLQNFLPKHPVLYGR
jgi:phosphoadenylyl-sulfate reductase (thioredoxin)